MTPVKAVVQSCRANGSDQITRHLAVPPSLRNFTTGDPERNRTPHGVANATSPTPANRAKALAMHADQDSYNLAAIECDLRTGLAERGDMSSLGRILNTAPGLSSDLVVARPRLMIFARGYAVIPSASTAAFARAGEPTPLEIICGHYAVYLDRAPIRALPYRVVHRALGESKPSPHWSASPPTEIRPLTETCRRHIIESKGCHASTRLYDEGPVNITAT